MPTLGSVHRPSVLLAAGYFQRIPGAWKHYGQYLFTQYQVKDFGTKVLDFEGLFRLYTGLQFLA